MNYDADVAEAEERGAAREREACLMDCSKVSHEAALANESNSAYQAGVEDGADMVADRIRARSAEGEEK